MPSRLASCQIALPHILAQVDRLYLYLDQYEHIPPELTQDPKVVPVLREPDQKRLKCAGKFVGLGMLSVPSLYFGFDDDIIYPAGYVDHLAAALRRHRYRVIVGIHGAVYSMPCQSYTKGRQMLHFAKGLAFDCVVDELGTGTLAFHTGCIKLDPWQWPYKNKMDLTVMLEGVHQGVPRIAVRRPADFIQPIAQNQDDSLYRQSLINDSTETRLLQSAMQRYPGRWCMSN